MKLEIKYNNDNRNKLNYYYYYYYKHHPRPRAPDRYGVRVGKETPTLTKKHRSWWQREATIHDIEWIKSKAGCILFIIRQLQRRPLK